MPTPDTLRVAAVQVESRNGDAAGNLGRAEALVARAASDGARLVVCPEFLAAGYLYDESIWRAGEPREGPTETWLRRLAAKHAVHLGASYLEAEGDDFFNTFALADPRGEIAGRVRKESLPAFEGWYFRSSPDPKTIDTDLGRVAVGICQDNHTARFFARLVRDEPDLVLMPHSAPCVPLAAAAMRDKLRDIAPHYATAFGVPVVLVNKARGRCRSPLPGVPLVRVRFDFPGESCVCDSDGRLVGRLPGDEGVVVADVRVDPTRKRRPALPADPYWSLPPRVLPRALGAWFAWMERRGMRAYERSAARRLAARAAGAPGAGRASGT